VNLGALSDFICKSLLESLFGAYQSEETADEIIAALDF